MNPSWKLLRGGAIGMGGRGVLMVVQLASHLVLARSLGTSGYGVLSLAVPIAVLGTFVARAGIPRTIQKYLPAYRTDDDTASAHGLYRWSFRWLLIIGLVVTVILLLSAEALEARVLRHAGLAPTVIAVSISVVFANLVCWLGSLGLSLGRVRLEVLGQHIVQPSAYLVLLAAIVIYSNGLSPVAAAVAFSASWTITAVLLWWQSGEIREELSGSEQNTRDSREWGVYSYRASFPDLVNRVRGWIDLIVAGALMASTPFGILALCLRIAYLPSNILASFASIFSHKIGELFAAGELEKLGREYSDVTFSSLSFSAPLIALLYVLSDWILALFGPDFSGGVLTLRLVLLGQLAVAIAGPCWYIMILTGFERELLRFSLAATVISILLCLALIPQLGIVGAGIANAVSLTLLSGAQVLLIRRRLGMSPCRLGFLRLLPPLALALALVALRRNWLAVPDVHIDAMITVIIFGAAYVVFGIPFGVWHAGLIGHVLEARKNESTER